MKVRLWKVVLGIVLVALLVGGGAMLYRAGYAHGVMSDVSFEEMPFAHGDTDGMMPGYGMPYGGMRGYHGQMGFFPLGRLLFGGLIFLLILGCIFRFFGMRRYWAMNRMDYEGKGAPPWMWHHRHPYWGEMNPDDEEKKEESEA